MVPVFRDEIETRTSQRIGHSPASGKHSPVKKRFYEEREEKHDFTM
jgi:hypothetical protein